MDQLRAMQIFRTVADCRSFAMAADRLDLPRPTVTNAVQSIERQLGVRLLQRTTRKVSLTREGEIYLERCARVLADVDDLHALFRSTSKPSGVVRVDLPERMAHLQLIPLLPDFFERYPDLQLRLGASDRFVDLVDEGVDCALRVGTLRDSTLVARRIGQMEQINVAAPAYLDKHGLPRTPADLPRHLAVNFYSHQSGRDLDWEYVEDGAVRTVAMRALVSVSGSGAYVASCLAGLGLIQAPRFGLEPHLRSGELVEVMADRRPAPLPVSLVVSHNRHLSARVRAFIDWVADVLVVR